MKKTEILKFIKNNDYLSFIDWIEEGGDINLTINRRSILEHAVRSGSKNCARILLLYGADPAPFQKRSDWYEVTHMMDPDFLEMMKDMEVISSSDLRIQYMLNVLSDCLLVKRKLAQRSILAYSDPKRDHRALHCGLHIFETGNWGFLTRAIKDSFQCGNDSKNKKYVLIISSIACARMEEIPYMSKRLTGFLILREVPVCDEQNVLDELLHSEELYIGTHYSDTPSLVQKDETLDVTVDFGASMNETVCNYHSLKFHESRHRFKEMRNWDHEINRWVKSFKISHGVYPNIMLASENTYLRIEMVANTNGKNHIQSPEGSTPESFVSMEGFHGEEYYMDFCIDESLGPGEVKLVHDHGGGGGERDDEWLAAVAG